MKTVHEIAEISGVSVRTLHHYDAIGLLRPAERTEAGYRLYDDSALRRLQDILLFRELRFPLREIRRILDHPEHDRKEALQRQTELLRLERDHIDGLIALAEKLMKGNEDMSFEAFSRKEEEAYAEEVKFRWGNTEAYRESIKKTETQNAEAGDGLMAMFKALGKMHISNPGEAAAQKWVGELQAYITEHFYPCTTEILAGLGEMYAGDERFRKNIDTAGGEGTADLAAEAIRKYCGK